MEFKLNRRMIKEPVRFDPAADQPEAVQTNKRRRHIVTTSEIKERHPVVNLEDSKKICLVIKNHKTENMKKLLIKIKEEIEVTEMYTKENFIEAMAMFLNEEIFAASK